MCVCVCVCVCLCVCTEDEEDNTIQTVQLRVHLGIPVPSDGNSSATPCVSIATYQTSLNLKVEASCTSDVEPAKHCPIESSVLSK